MAVRVAPCLNWMRTYDVKDLLTDVMAGIAVTCLIIPQGAPSPACPAPERS